MQDQIVSEKVAGKNMLDSLNAPVYFFSFDHPGSFCNIIHNSPEYMTVLTLDQYYLKYTEKYLRRKAIFFPPGGEELEEASDYLNIEISATARENIEYVVDRKLDSNEDESLF